MKKMAFMLVLCILSVFLFSQISQTASLFNFQGEYVSVFSGTSQQEAENLAHRLDAYMDLYDSVLHYDLTSLSSRMRVKIFTDKTAFDAYLQRLIGETKDSFVFLQYSDISKSELVCYNQEDTEQFDRALIHHSFIQYLKAFIDNPPLWLQKGFAVYFEKSVYDINTGSAMFHPNLGWVNTLKESISGRDGIIPVSILLSMDVSEANKQIELFYSQSWGLVNFLLNSTNTNYNRILWDSLTSMSPSAEQTENEDAILSNAFVWVNKDKFVSDFQNFCLDLKTFPDLVESGIARFSEKDYENAQETFNKAIELRDDHPVPYYYLGLISYYMKDFAMAEYYYSISLEKGGEEPLTYYALGVNAYSDQRYEDSLSYLNLTVEKDPNGYGVKAQVLMSRINEAPETEDGETGLFPEDTELTPESDVSE